MEQGQLFYNKILLWSCAYYKYGLSIVDDETFDKIFRELKYWWKDMEHPNKNLLKKGNFTTGSLFDIEFPEWCHAIIRDKYLKQTKDCKIKLTKFCEKHGMYGEHLNTCPVCFGETALGKNGKLKPERYFNMSESKEQIKLIQWSKRQREIHPEIRWLHAIPNGGNRDIHTGSKLKLEGVESGVFDLFLPVSRFNKHGLYIEMKYGKGKLSDNQIEFKKFVITQGYATAICYSFEEGKKILKKYLGI